MEEVRGNYWDEPNTQLAMRKKKKDGKGFVNIKGTWDSSQQQTDCFI